MRVISILSGKGGVGKTTTVANLGLALSMVFNKKVVLLDGNSTTPDLGLHLGMYSFPHTLEDVLMGKIPITEALYHHPQGISILPSTLSINTSEVDLRDLKTHYKALEDYDIALLDSPPGLGRGIAPTIDITDEILVVTNPEIPAITDALRLVEVAKIAGVPITGVVLNRVRKEKYELSTPEVESVFDVPLIGSIPEDARVRESIAFGNPIVSNSPYSPAAVGFKKLAGHIIGQEYRASFLDRLKSWLGFGRKKPAPQVKIEVKAIEKPAKEEIALEMPVPEKQIIEETPEAKVEEAKPKKPREPIKRIIEKKKAVRVPTVEIGLDWSRFLAPQYKSKAPSELIDMGVDVIQGIDESYMEKLTNAGYNTVGALSKAEVDDVKRKAGLSAPLSDYFIAAAKAIAKAAEAG